MKKRYKVELDEKVVEKVKDKSSNSRISPLINNLLKLWATSKEEVESLYNKIKRNEKEEENQEKKKEVVSKLKKISSEE